AHPARAQNLLLVPTSTGRPDSSVLSLREMRVDVGLARGFASVSVRQVFENRTATDQEGTWRFVLPPSGAVGDFAVWDASVRIPGVILEKKRARAIYRDLTTQRIDPGLLQQGDEDDDDLGQELSAMLMRCEYYRTAVSDFVAMRLDDHVYWVEKGGRNEMNIQLYAAPLNVNEILRKVLFNGELPVVLTSATLSVSGKLDYYMRRIGFDNGTCDILDTPFDYENQVKIYIPKNMPLPDEENYLESACDEIENYISRTHGKAFVLFTSYDNMKRSSDRLRPFFDDKGITLLVQGEGKSRSAMLSTFKQDVDSVIFGVTSFWMGVDVPGEALSNVIITKLPFAVPSHPLVQARSERIEREGGKSFMDYSLPEAVLRFRQGVGRLIRKKTDKGIIVILDRRIISKRYGSIFLNSIPKCQVEIC
ncbi:MAG: helicase C-terminal domain-containing protein, partial [bacterium]